MAKKIDYASMFTKRSDERYQGTYTDTKTGKRHFVYDRDPEKLYFKILDAQKPKALTLRDVAEQWEEEGWEAQKLSEGTRAAYKAPVEQMLEEHGDFVLEDVTAAEINRVMLKEQANNYSYKHAAALLSMYKQTFKFAIIKGYTLNNPALAITIPRGMKKTTREAPEDDIIQIIKDSINKTFGLFAFFLLYTGFRAGEAMGLTWGDIDYKNKTVRCERSVERHTATPHTKDPKSKAGYRTVPLLDDLEKRLTKPKNAKSSDLVFPNDDGGLFTNSQLRAKWTQWGKAVGLTELVETEIKDKKTGEKKKKTYYRTTLSQHQLRHGYCTILYEAGIDELTAMELMGHADIETTRRIYTHLRQKKRAGVADILNKQFASIDVKADVKNPERSDNKEEK